MVDKVSLDCVRSLHSKHSTYVVIEFEIFDDYLQNLNG